MQQAIVYDVLVIINSLKAIMKKRYLIFCFILILGAGCNLFTTYPTCEIISPNEGGEIIKGTAISISVNVESEESLIFSVFFYIDSDCIGGVIPGMLDSTENDYSIIWNTDSLNFGKHTIKVVAENFDGIKKSDEIEVNIIALPEVSFGSYTDTRDGHTYRTVQIGSQTWMADNLAFLPAITSPSNSSYSESYYYVYGYYGVDIDEAKTTDYYKTYGVLYNWQSAINACPAGWHLPDSTEWNILSQYINGFYGNAYNNAKALAANSKWKKANDAGDVGYDISSNNHSGFSGLPSGYYLKTNYGEGIFQSIEEDGIWWSSTVMDDSNQPLFSKLTFDFPIVGTNYYGYKDCGYSVRCIKN